MIKFLWKQLKTWRLLVLMMQPPKTGQLYRAMSNENNAAETTSNANDTMDVGYNTGLASATIQNDGIISQFDTFVVVDS